MNSKQASPSPSVVGPRPADQVIYEPKLYKRLKHKARNMRRKGWNKNTPSYKFYENHDWKALQEEFNSAISETGAYRYGSVADFIRAKFSTAQERRFARWVIGTQPVTYVPWEGNWALERFMDHWKQDERVKSLCEKLRQEIDAQRVVATTAELWADDIGRIITMQAQIDELYGGRLFLEGLSKKANQARAREYREWVDWGMNALAKAVDGMMDSLCGKQRVSIMAMERTVQNQVSAGQAPGMTQEQEDAEVQTTVQRLVMSAVSRSRALEKPMPLLEEALKQKA